MWGKEDVRQRKALEILMEIDDSPEKPRYRVNHTEPNL